MTSFRPCATDCLPKNSSLSESRCGRIAFGRSLWFLGQFILLVWLVSLSWAGDISGKVTDPSGAVVIGAIVTVRNADTGTSYGRRAT